MLISIDQGLTFYRPQNLPAGCGQGKLVHGNGIVVLASQQLCISSDSGRSWTAVNRQVGYEDQLLFANGEFLIYRTGVVDRSVDGQNWTTTSLTSGSASAPNLILTKMAYHPELNRFVGLNQSWGHNYEQTQYYYSNDGINWHQVQKELGRAPLAPHPIRHIESGYLTSCQ